VERLSERTVTAPPPPMISVPRRPFPSRPAALVILGLFAGPGIAPFAGGSIRQGVPEQRLRPVRLRGADRYTGSTVFGAPAPRFAG
jgi:hypothetical protein